MSVQQNHLEFSAKVNKEPIKDASYCQEEEGFLLSPQDILANHFTRINETLQKKFNNTKIYHLMDTLMTDDWLETKGTSP